jgi:hypothetical protein
MSTITVSLPEKRLAELSERANQLGVVPEELVRASVEDLLTRPEAELYRRLA